MSPTAPNPVTHDRANSCDVCGQPHPRCYAHKDGRPCQAWPRRGGRVCKVHGGRSPNAIAGAERRVGEATAARELARLGQPVTVHPAEALIDLVHWTAGEVAYWRQVVVEIEAEDGHRGLTWGVTKHEKGTQKGEETNVKTHEAATHVAYRMLTDASNRLAAYAGAALKANVDERRVRLAEEQGTALAGAVRRILERLNLTPDQAALVGVVVPEELRRLAPTQEPA